MKEMKQIFKIVSNIFNYRNKYCTHILAFIKLYTIPGTPGWEEISPLINADSCSLRRLISCCNERTFPCVSSFTTAWNTQDILMIMYVCKVF